MSAATRPLAVAFALLGLLGPAVSLSAADVKLVRLPDPAADFAIAPDGGPVAAAVPGRDELVVYPKVASQASAVDAVRIKVGRRPAAVEFKRVGDKGYFVVACEAGNELRVIDAATLKEVKAVPTEVPGPNFLAASRNPDDPHVYYCGGGERGTALARVDLRAFKDRGPVVAPGTLSVTELGVSADGTLLYPRHRNVGPWGQPALAVSDRGVEPVHTARFGQAPPESTGPYATDPFGQFVACGRVLYTPDLRKELRKLPAAPLLVSAARPILVGVEADLMTVVSRNTFQLAAAVPLTDRPVKQPAGKAPKRPAAGRPPAKADEVRTRVLEAPKDRVLLVCRGSTVWVVPDAALGLKDEPFLVVRPVGPTALTVDRKETIKLVPHDPKVAMKLDRAPAGVELKDGALTWTPTGSQVGPHTVTVEVSAGERRATLELTLTVRRPSVALGTGVTHWAVDEAGTVAVVLDAGRPFPAVQGRPSARVTVIDLQELKEVATTTLDVPAAGVAVDAHHVYVGLGNAEAVYALSRKDLSLARKVFAPGHVTSMVSVADRLLFVTTHRGHTLVLRTPSLEQAEPADVGAGVHEVKEHADRPWGRFHVPEPVRGGWVFDGVVYDEALRKVRGLAWGQGFWQASRDAVSPARWPGMLTLDAFGGMQTFTWLLPWATQASGGQLTRGSRAVGMVQARGGLILVNQAAAVLPDFPAVAWVGGTQDQNPDGTQRGKAELAFADLVGAQTHLTMTLADEPLPVVQPFGPGDVKLAVRPGKVVAIAYGRLFVVAVPKLDPDRFPKPVHASAPPPVLVLGDKPLQVPLTPFTAGGAPADVSMRTEQPGVDVAADKRHLVVDPKAVAARLTDALATHLAAADLADGGKAKTPDERLDAYLVEAAPRFEKLVGRKPAGVPMWLPLEVTVKTRDLQALEVTFGVLAEVPEGRVRTAARAAAEAARKASPPAPAGGDGVADLARRHQDLQRRVTELDNKLGEMNRKLDLLAELLKSKGKE